MKRIVHGIWCVAFSIAFVSSVRAHPTVRAEPAEPPVVEGRKSALTVAVENPTEDVVVVASISTDRSADESLKGLKSQYGDVYKNDSGQIVYNRMAQMASPEIFFDSSAVVLPGRTGVFGHATRFFDQKRKIVVSYYRIPLSFLPHTVFAQKDGIDSAYTSVVSVKDLENGHGEFILWRGSALKLEEAGVSLLPAVAQAPFGLKTARGMLPRGTIRGTIIEETSYCDTFSAWVFRVEGSTWLVREGGAEKLGNIESLVFEKIDGNGGQNIDLRVPEEVFTGRYPLTEGDGMYRVGWFLAVSGEKILDVLRILRDQRFPCRVNYYFFESWFLDAEEK
jgi:hypothetical protein